ncbi:carboxylesterase/lipase family protein [Mixta intestinalis]|uniref:Carboxylic ester hydrolase n=1 Tax=Mixta intestinalis TaxID=1615494 RepID=A0A6P1PY84_9GAMM|nr:carboxylesterase/lipase family protein [Mixta intestinalis]QHM71062.1 Para-nitrobenzyl esterase [Mixta intestinalis]
MRNEPLTIHTAEGALRGTVDDGVFVFKGIPYAAPPVGALRWRGPKPVAPWQGVRDALQWGNASWQNREYCVLAGGGEPGPLSEDCLYLNVWTPDMEPARSLPVMVWIHGGGFSIGAGGLPPYNGRALAARGVVLVTLNYRLGHLGFFAHPALDAEVPQGEAINNFALLDQIAALQWVQRNITAFGGDRRNVTIFGESSGGRSVLSLFTSPLAAGLFHKGIVQSAYSLPDKKRAEALACGVAVAHHLGLDNATAEELRALPADSFWSLPAHLGNGPVAIAGDRVLPKPMVEVFTAARQHRYPLMIGYNSDEASVLEYFGVNATAVITELRARRPLALKLIRSLYDEHDDVRLGRKVARDMAFGTMTLLAVQAQQRRGVPGWRYYFDYVSENSRDLCRYGSWHGNEIPYVMDTLNAENVQMADRPFTAGDRQFAHRVSEYWLRFAQDATEFSHQLAGETPWPAWRSGEDITLRFGMKGEAAIVPQRRFMRLRLRLLRLLARAMVRLTV